MQAKKPNLRRINPLSASLTGALVLVGATGPALATPPTTYYWTVATQGSGTPNNYGTAASWSTNPVSGGTGASPGSADTAVFSQSSKYGNTNSRIGADKSLAALQFYNSGTTSITTNTTTQRTLTIGTGGIYMDSGAGAVNISTGGLPVAVAVSGSENWTNNSSNMLTLGDGANKSLTSTATSTVTLSGNFTFVTPITTGTGTLSITQSGGTVIYSAANTYTGATQVNGGTLQLDGSTAFASTVTVGSSGTLAGTGTVTGTAIVNGILSPGDVSSIGKLTAATLTFGNSSTFSTQINSGSLTGDLQVVSASNGLTLGSGGTVYLNLSDLGSTALAPNTTISLMNYAGTLNGGYFTLAGPNTLLTPNTQFTLGSNTWKITYADTTAGSNATGLGLSGNFINLTTLTAIPEPGSLLALGCLVGSGALLRNRRRS